MITVGMAVLKQGNLRAYLIENINQDNMLDIRNRFDIWPVSLQNVSLLKFPFVLQLQDDTVVVAKSITAFVGEDDGSNEFYMSEWGYSRKPIDILQEMVTAKFLLIQGGESYQMIPVPQIKRFFLHPQWLTPPDK